jgi:hypothetical protein
MLTIKGDVYMQKQTAKTYGVLIALLAVLGFVTDSPTFGFINTDNVLDMLRVVLAAMLLYAGFKSDNENFIRGLLVFVGVLYIGMGVLGLLDSKLWGLLPSGLTGFDVLFHLVTGIVAALVGMKATAIPPEVKPESK